MRGTHGLGRLFPWLQMSRGMATISRGHPGFVELREYTLHPQGIEPFIKLTQEKIDVRNRLLPLLGMFTCDIGGTLNKIVHFYHYKDFDERDATRRLAAVDREWQEDYLPHSRPHVSHQQSSAYLPALGVLEAAGATPIQQQAEQSSKSNSSPGMYELRQYQLHPGYGSVPKLLEAFQKGLPEKIAADPQGQLVFFGYTDVGILNSVIELWRYPTAGSCIRARQAARQVPAWKEAIASVTPGVQTFQSSFLRPLPFSPLQ